MKLKRGLLAILIIGLVVSLKIWGGTTINAENVRPFDTINDIVFGNGYFLGVGDNGYVVKSTDGKKWDIVAEGITGQSFSNITFGDGKFLALGSGKKYYISTDGVNWTEYNRPDHCGIIKYVNGKFFTFGYTAVYNPSTYLSDHTNYLYESSDGISWSKITVPGVPSIGSAGITDIAYGLGTYVMSTNQAVYYLTANLSSWSTKAIAEMYDWNWVSINSISFQNDKFVSRIYNGDILYSTNPASSWSKLTNVNANGSTYLNGKYIIYSKDSIYSTSTSFTTWASWNTAQPPMDVDNSWYGFIDVAYGNNLYITTDGNYIDYSEDLINWTKVTGMQIPDSEPTIGTLSAPGAVMVGEQLSLTIPAVEKNGPDITAQGWEVSSNGVDGWNIFNSNTIMSSSDNGKYLRYFATNSIGTTYSNPVSITVNKKNIELNEAQQSYTYNGSQKAFLVKGTPDSGYIITYLQGGNPVTPVLAGTYDVQITRVTDNTYNAFDRTIIGGLVINKAVPAAVTFPTASGVTYGQALSDSVLSGGSGDGTFAWADVTKIPTVSNSGYEVIFTPSDTTNYDYSEISLSKIINVSVAKRKLTVTDPIVTKTKNYDGNTNAQAQVGTITNKVGTDDVSVAIGSASYVDAGVGTGKTITIAYSLNGAAADNYSAPDNYVITDGAIDALVPGPVVWDDKTVTYTGEAKTNIMDSLPTGTTGVSYTYDGRTDAPVNAGSYTVEATFTMETRYAQLEAVTRTLTINKAVPAAVTFPTASGLTYGNKLNNSVLTGESGSGTFAWTDGDQIPTVSNSGYEVTFTPSDTANYDYTGVMLVKTIAVAVDKRILTVTAPVVTKTKNYDGNTNAQAHVGTITNKVGMDDVGVAISSASYMDAGVGNGKTITIAYSLNGADADNYSAPDNYVINDGAIDALVPGTVVWNDKTVTYTGEAKTNIMESLPTGTNGVSYTYDGKTDAPVNAGTYTVEATFTMETGYAQLEAATRTLTINKAIPAAVTFPTASGLTYGHTLNNSVLTEGSGSGTFAWTDGDQIPTVSNSGYEMTFIPSDTENYDYTGIILVKKIAVVVTKRSLTVTDPVVTKIKNYDGNTNAQAQVGTITNKVGTDDVGVSISSASYVDAGVGIEKTITITYSITGGAAGNYNTPDNYVITDGAINALVPGPVVWNDKTVTYTGEAKTNIMDSLPTGTNGVSYTYDGKTDAPVNAGTYTVEVTFTMETGYAQLEATSRTLTINKAIPEAVTFPTASGLTYGDKLNDSVLTGGSGSGTFAWTDGDQIPTVSNSGYEVTFVPYDKENYDYTGIILVRKIDVVVTKRSLTVTDPVVTKIKNYDGNTKAQAQIGTITNKVGTDDVGVAISNASYEDAGVGTGKIITITYSITGGAAGNYNAPDNYVITDGAINALVPGTVVWNDKTVTYTGKEQTNEIDTLPAGVDQVTYTYDGKTDAPVNVGTYTVEAVFTMKVGYGQLNTISKALTINKAIPAAVTFPTASGITYGQSLSESTLNGGSGSGTFAWTDGTQIPTVSNSGYELTFTPSDAANFDYTGIVLSQIIKISVERKTLIVKDPILVKEKDYDGGTIAQASPGTIENKVGTDDVTVSVKSAQYDNESVGDKKTIIINYEIAGKDAENYNAPESYVIQDGIINALKTGKLVWTDKTTVYNGDKIANTIAEMPEGVADITYTYNGEGEPPVNAGTYTVSAVFIMKKGYEQLESATKILTIEKARPSQVIFPSASEIEYGNQLSESTLTEGSGDGVFAWTNGSTIPTVENNGYELVFTPKDEKNYDYSNMTLKKTINVRVLPRTVELVWSGTDERVYDATESNISAKVNNLLKGDTCTVEVTGGNEKNAGTYIATVLNVSNSNYCLPQNVNIKYVIRKAHLKITPDTKEKTVGQKDPELTYTQSGLLEGDEITGTLVREAGEVAGLYAIKSNFSNKNYNIEYTGNYFKITNSPGEQVKLPVGSISGKVIDNTDANLTITLSLYLGDKPIYTVVLDNKGEYKFSALKDGYYNLVADNGRYRVTDYIQIKNQESVTGSNIQFTRMQSKVEIISTSNQDSNIADLIVNGLNAIYSSDTDYTKEDRDIINNQDGSIIVKLVVEDKQEKDIQIAADAIKAIASNKNIPVYFDLSVIKTALTNGGNQIYNRSLSLLDKTLRIVIPIPDSLRGKSGMVIYRIHDGVAEALPEYTGSGEGYSYDTEYFYIYTRKFSTYAIGYDSSKDSNTTDTNSGENKIIDTDVYTESPGLTETTASNAIVKESPKTADTKSTGTVCIIFILSGAILIFARKRKTEEVK